MRKLCAVALTLSLTALLVAPAPGQQQQRQRGQGRGGMQNPVASLLQNESVQKELKLDEEQVTKTKEAIKKVQEKYAEASTKLRELSQEEQRQKRMELGVAQTEDTLKSVSDILKPEQTKRLKQIQLQQGGSRAFSQPDVQKALDLTTEQKDKIKTIQDDTSKAMRELGGGRGQGGRGQGGRQQGGNNERVTALRKEALEKTQSLLTDDQKKIWKDLTGEPFKLEQRRRGGQQQ